MGRVNYNGCAKAHDLLVQLCAQGLPDAEIGRQIGVNQTAVSLYRRKHGIEKAPRARRYGFVGACERNHDTVKAMAEAGATLDAIGQAVGTTKRHVRQYLTKTGIQRPEWREAPAGAHPMARPTGGELNPAWKGGRTVDEDGYVLVWKPEHPEANRHGQVREHRLVMEQVLGRPLTRTEVVDHINGNTGDNRPENLRLFPNNGEHLRVTLTGRRRRPSAQTRSTANPGQSGTSDQQ